MPGEYERVDGGGKVPWIPIVGCGGCCLFILIILYGIVPWYAGLYAGFPAFLKLSKGPFEYINMPQPNTEPEIVEYIWWPGCTKKGKKDAAYLKKCAPPCYSPDLIPAVVKLAKDLPFEKVSYPSRKDKDGKTVHLKGWLLTGDKKNLPKGVKAPRVVIQHGFTSSSNNWFPSLMAYHMRALGFDVLLNNLRDHGYSQNTSYGGMRLCTWGYVYHYDILGAWDYLKDDPDGKLGGKLPKSQVGLLGGSMGAFATINAFTLDPDVPAAWVDSPPRSPQDAFFFNAVYHPTKGIKQLEYVLPLPGIKPLVWYWMTSKLPSGVDVLARTPIKEIPKAANNKRPIQLVHNKPDGTVPQQAAVDITALLKKFPQKYDIKPSFYTDAKCKGETHLVTALLKPQAFREKLCDFWTEVFKKPKSMCGLNTLPNFTLPLKKRRLEQMLALEALDQRSVVV